jgi:4-amino-4-deoxy-L-arabinose transferase-like glycosyltransferase
VHSQMPCERLLLLFVLLLAAWLFWREPLAVPPGLEMDELIEAEIAQQILDGDWRLFYTAGQGREPLFHYWLALWLALLGPALFSLRIASSTVSLLTLAATYRFTRALFGPRVAFATSLFGVTTFWVLFAARSGLRSVTLPFFAAITGFLFWRGLHSRSTRAAYFLMAGAGVTLALSFYSYTAARVLPFVFVAFILYLFLFHRRRLQGRLFPLTLAGLLTTALLLPLLLFLRMHPEADEFAFMDFNRPLAALQAGDPAPAAETTLQTMAMFTLVGDPLIFDNVPGRPVFSDAVGLFFYLGLLIVLWRWRRPEYALILIWLPITLVPGMLSQPAPNFYRTVGVQPVAAVFPAVAIVSLYHFARSRLPQRHLVTVLGVGLVLILAGDQLVQTWRDYFIRWPEVEGVHFFWQRSLFSTARYLDNQAVVDDVVICTSLVNEQDPWWRPARQSMPFLLQRTDLQIRFFDCRQTFVVTASDPMLYILPDDIPLASLPPLFGRSLDAGDVVNDALPANHGTVYRAAPASFITTGGDVALPPEAGGTAVDLPVSFGDSLLLVGYDYLGDELGPGAAVPLLTAWQVMRTPPANLALFTHILSDPQTVVAQQDALALTTRSLQPGDRFWVLHNQLWLPADAPMESYLVAIGLYERASLARLPLTGAEVGGADRLFLAPVSWPPGAE